MKVLLATPLVNLIFLLVVTTTTVTEVVSSSSSDGDAEQQCNGVPPQPDMIKFLEAIIYRRVVWIGIVLIWYALPDHP